MVINFRFDPAREHTLRELDAVIRAAAPTLQRLKG
jgi:hypothetical protein